MDDELPIRPGGEQKRIIIDKTSGNMKRPRKADDFYVDVQESQNMKAAVRRTLFILEKAGINPNEVKVELSARS